GGSNDVVADFRLQDHLGRSHQLHRYVDMKLVLLAAWKYDCTDAQAVYSTLGDIANALGEGPTALFGVSPAPIGAYDALRNAAGQATHTVPLLLDEAQTVSPLL